MTLQQQAYGLIDILPEESVYALIQVMMRMLPYEQRDGAKTAGESKTILAELEDYNARTETAYLLSHPGTARDIQEGLDTAWEDCVPESEALA